MASDQLSYVYGDKTLQDLINLQEKGDLNLNPGFQRQSVWNNTDRRKLIQSILDKYPIPSIFLYRREENGRPVYDVLDGKQRIETVFMFTRTRGFGRDGFDVRVQFPEDDASYSYNWRDLKDWDKTYEFLSYRIQTVEVSGDLSPIVDLFVRINSTGKALTSSEKRRARFYNSDLLKLAERLARRQRNYLRSLGVVTQTQIARMKDVELVTELIASVINDGPLNKKTAVDRAVGNESINGNTLRRATAEVSATFATLKRMLPDLKTTRFRRLSEFYTLFMVVWDLRRQKRVLTHRSRNRTAADLVRRFSNGVDYVRELQRRAKGSPRGHQLYVEYLLTVQQSTDALPQRQRRAHIVRGLLAGLFEKKDPKRVFSSEQRRLLWNSDEQKKCSQCEAKLTWLNFQVDHVKAHSRGGATALRNAALICAPCNASKGAGRGRRRRKR